MSEPTQEAYAKIDRYLRNNLDDDAYAEYSAALDLVSATPEGYVLVPMVLAATLTISPFKGYENTEFQYHGNLPAGTYVLYAAAQKESGK